MIAAMILFIGPTGGLDQYNALNIDAEIMGDNLGVGGSTKTDTAELTPAFSNYEGNENYTLSSLGQWTTRR